MRLPGFPVPEPDETVHSVVSRHLQCAATHATRHLAILGLDRTFATAVAPPDIARLAGAMPLGHPWLAEPSLILTHHTVVPWCLAFAQPGLATKVLKDLVSGEVKNPAATLGLTTQKASMAGAKFCPECVQSDEQERGFSVFYRQHQPTIVKVCAKHRRPLQWNCRACQVTAKAADSWQMAGRCKCKHPIEPPACSTSLDAWTMDGLVWMAVQVQAVLTSFDVQTGAVAPAALLDRLKQAGFGARTGLDTSAIKGALSKRFGKLFFSEIGCPDLVDQSEPLRWPAKVLSSNVIAGERKPNSIKMLLLASLVCDDISQLRNDWFQPNGSAGPEVPRGYGSKGVLNRPLLSARDIQDALAQKSGMLSAAAQLLSVSPSALAVDMRRLGMNCPLTPQMRKRLGADKISEVKAALGAGMAKQVIQRELGISEWSLQLIELDEPALTHIHRKATVELQRQAHRQAIVSYLASNPAASRSELARDCAGACDWLRRFDARWLEKVWPGRRSASVKAPRLKRQDWAEVDRRMVAEVDLMVKQEISSGARPIRLSPTAMLRTVSRRVGFSAMNRDRTPLVWEEVERRAESINAYIRRKIKWALSEHARTRTPVSMNTLRRTAAMAPAVLIAHRDFVQECARDLRMMIDARCALSAFRD